jgi:hypothetical protein
MDGLVPVKEKAGQRLKYSGFNLDACLQKANTMPCKNFSRIAETILHRIFLFGDRL